MPSESALQEELNYLIEERLGIMFDDPWQQPNPTEAAAVYMEAIDRINELVAVDA